MMVVYFAIQTDIKESKSMPFQTAYYGGLMRHALHGMIAAVTALAG